MKRAREHGTPVASKPIKRRAVAVVVNKAIASNEEKKNLDVPFTGVQAVVVFGQATAQRWLLNAANQGTTASTRAGRRITMKNMSWLFNISLAPTTTGASPLRFLVVYDKQTNGAAPAATDVLVSDIIGSPMNLNNSRRFKILVDEVYDGIGTQGPGSIMRKGFRDFTKGGRNQGLEVEFKDASGNGIADILTGSVYAFVWQDGNLLIANPTAYIYTRIRFTDA